MWALLHPYEVGHNHANHLGDLAHVERPTFVVAKAAVTKLEFTCVDHGQRNTRTDCSKNKSEAHIYNTIIP